MSLRFHNLERVELLDERTRNAPEGVSPAERRKPSGAQRQDNSAGVRERYAAHYPEGLPRCIYRYGRNVADQKLATGRPDDPKPALAASWRAA